MDHSANIKPINGISKYIISKDKLGQDESKMNSVTRKEKKSEYNKFYYLTKKLEQNAVHITNKKIKDKLFELVESKSKNLIEKLELENKHLIERFITMTKKVLNFIIKLDSNYETILEDIINQYDDTNNEPSLEFYELIIDDLLDYLKL